MESSKCNLCNDSSISFSFKGKTICVECALKMGNIAMSYPEDVTKTMASNVMTCSGCKDLKVRVEALEKKEKGGKWTKVKLVTENVHMIRDLIVDPGEAAGAIKDMANGFIKIYHNIAPQ